MGFDDRFDGIRGETFWKMAKKKPLIVGGGLNDPKLPKTKKSKCYQTFLGAVLCIKAGENFEFGER